jgi:hypothetical protein
MKEIKLWCYCSVSPWNLGGQVLHKKEKNKLVCTNCGRGE